MKLKTSYNVGNKNASGPHRNKGIPISKSHKKNISLSKLGKKRKPFTKEHKEKIGSGNSRGKHSTLMSKERLAGRPRPKRCEVCKSWGRKYKKGLCFEHNHKTGEFRGWVCHRCNYILGLAKDDFKLLENLATYLKKNI